MRSYTTYTYSAVPRLSRAVFWLICINVVVFLLTPFLPAGFLGLFGLVPDKFLKHGYLWQVVTYLFLHSGIIHIFFNMLFLWMMGSEIERYWGSREFVKYYFVTGCGAGIINALVQPSSNIPTIGASGAIFGLIIAFALAFPEREIILYFFFRIKAKHFAVLVGLLELLSLLAVGNRRIATFAHLGGLVVGYFYIKSEKYLYPLRKFYHRKRLELRDARERRRLEREIKIKEEIDRILDKIATQGIESLTDKERRFLEKRSKR